MNCGNCGANIPDSLSSCPACGVRAIEQMEIRLKEETKKELLSDNEEAENISSQVIFTKPNLKKEGLYTGIIALMGSLFVFSLCMELMVGFWFLGSDIPDALNTIMIPFHTFVAILFVFEKVISFAGLILVGCIMFGCAVYSKLKNNKLGETALVIALLGIAIPILLFMLLLLFFGIVDSVGGDYGYALASLVIVAMLLISIAILSMIKYTSRAAKKDISDKSRNKFLRISFIIALIGVISCNIAVSHLSKDGILGNCLTIATGLMMIYLSAIIMIGLYRFFKRVLRLDDK